MIERNQYEERVIVFLDILGFKSHINKTTNDSAYFLKIRDALNLIANYKNYHERNEKDLGKEITVFSDSIVISYPVAEAGSVFFLILDIVHIQLEMMEKGLLMRGGITVGKLCHNDNIVYGPAMIEAYELESTAAVYPRVIVNEEVLETAYLNPLHTPREELEWIIDMLDKDVDGQLYVDFLTQGQEANNYRIYIKALFIIKRLIEEELANNLKTSVKMKYGWMKNKLNILAREKLRRADLIIK